MISLEQVTVQRQGVIALNQFTHTIHPGQSVAVIGPTGSGKTTLLETIASLLPIQSGRISFADFSSTNWTRSEHKNSLALCPTTSQHGR